MTKRSTTSKKVSSTRSRAAKLTHARNKAIARLDKWVDERHYVNLWTGDLRFAGELSRLGSANENTFGDYFFKSAFGVSAPLFLLLYDEISFEEIEGIPELVRLSHSRKPARFYVLESTGKLKPSLECISEITQQFELWIKLQTEVRVDFGDGMRITGNYCQIAKLSPDTFVFSITNTSFHIIRLSEVHLLHLMRENGKCAIVMHNRTANSYVTVSDANECVNAVFERFASLTKTVH